MKRLVSGILLTSCFWGAANLAHFPQPIPVMAQVPTSGDLYYTFYGQQIPLSVRSDVIAVAFKPQPGGTRGVLPAYRRLEQALQGGGGGNTRGIPQT
ncbi:MAG TPA: peptidase S8, partial [Cyanophyceae cyanobacterium]